MFLLHEESFRERLAAYRSPVRRLPLFSRSKLSGPVLLLEIHPHFGVEAFEGGLLEELVVADNFHPAQRMHEVRFYQWLKSVSSSR